MEIDKKSYEGCIFHTIMHCWSLGQVEKILNFYMSFNRCTILFLLFWANLGYLVRYFGSLEFSWQTKNKTIRDEGITVDFWIIKVHTSNLSSNNWGSSNGWGSSDSWGSSNSWDHQIVGDHRVPLDLSFEMIILKKPCNHPGNI